MLNQLKHTVIIIKPNKKTHFLVQRNNYQYVMQDNFQM